MRLTFNSSPIQEQPDAAALARALEKLSKRTNGAVGLERGDDERLVLILAGFTLELHLRRGADYSRRRLEPGAWEEAAAVLERYRRDLPLEAEFEEFDAVAEFPEIRRSVARMLSWKPLLLPRSASSSHPDDILLRGDPKGEACVIAYSDMATLLADTPAKSAKHVGFAELLAYAQSEERFACLMVHALGCWIPIPRADFEPMLEELGCPAL